MTNKMKRYILTTICLSIAGIILYLLSIITNLFRFSLTTFYVAFTCGLLTEFIIFLLGWED